jgi:hypothetical protein
LLQQHHLFQGSWYFDHSQSNLDVPQSIASWPSFLNKIKNKQMSHIGDHKKTWCALDLNQIFF